MNDDIQLKDPETGLYNTHYLSERLPAEFKRAIRYVYPLSLAVIEVQNGDQIRRDYSGDGWPRVIREFSDFLLEFARGNDVVIRATDDRFLIILPDTQKRGAVVFGERLLESVHEYIFDAKENKIHLKVSIGIGNFPEDGVRTHEGLEELAERAMKSALEKGGGKLFTFKGISKQDVESIVRKTEKDYVNHFKDRITDMVSEMNQSVLKIIRDYSESVLAKNAYGRDQAHEVVELVDAIGRSLAVELAELMNLRRAAELYHLGKIVIPEEILQKEGRLSDAEMDEVRRYPRVGAELLELAQFLKGVVPTVLSHRERFDGGGYPEGLKGKAIPLGARILALSDTYQALVSDRPYRKAFTREEAIEMIQRESGGAFDPDIVEAFMKVIQSA